jgi:hypothetical protein
MPVAAKFPNFALPLVPIQQSPTLATAGATVHDATLCIILAFWQSGCRQLPSDDAGLQALARTYGAQWMRVRDDVKQALSEIIPDLTAAAHARALRARQGRVSAARQGGLAKARKMRQEATAAVGTHTLTQPLCDIGRIQPVRASAYQGNGQTDMQACQASIQRERSAGTRIGFLTDNVRRPG